MQYLQALLVAALIGEFFALIHHGSLAVRTRAAAKRGVPEAVVATQHDLLVLQAISAAVVGAAVGIRALRGLDASLVAAWGGYLFAMVFAAGVYVRYPEAAPIAIAAPSWTTGSRSAEFLGGMRYLWAVIAVLMALVLFVVLVLANS